MFVGILECDVLLGDIHSLKEKRALVRPVIAEIRRRWSVAVAEAGHVELHRRALIGVATLAGDAAHCRELMDTIETFVAHRPELELLSARQRLVGPDD